VEKSKLSLFPARGGITDNAGGGHVVQNPKISYSVGVQGEKSVKTPQGSRKGDAPDGKDKNIENEVKASEEDIRVGRKEASGRGEPSAEPLVRKRKPAPMEAKKSGRFKSFQPSGRKKKGKNLVVPESEVAYKPGGGILKVRILTRKGEILAQ